MRLMHVLKEKLQQTHAEFIDGLCLVKKKRGKTLFFEFSSAQSGTVHSFQIWWAFCIKIHALEILKQITTIW